MTIKTQSRLWVFGQFAMLALLCIPGRSVPISPLSLLLIGAALGIVTLARIHMREGTFNVEPTPREHNQLTQSGPYRWVRHPMYFSLLVIGVAYLVDQPSLWRLVALLGLGLVLNGKRKLEERLLTEMHPEYHEYAGKVKAILPCIY